MDNLRYYAVLSGSEVLGHTWAYDRQHALSSGKSQWRNVTDVSDITEIRRRLDSRSEYEFDRDMSRLKHHYFD